MGEEVAGGRTACESEIAKVTEAPRRVSDLQYVLRHDYFTNTSIPALSQVGRWGEQPGSGCRGS